MVRFSVISDTHIQRADSDSTTKFKKAMAQLRKIEDLSAVLINGDVTDYCTPAEVNVLNDALGQLEGTGFDFDAVKLLLNMGNHELFDAEINYGDQGGGIPTQAEAKPHYHGGTTYKNVLGDKMYTDEATADQVELGFQHVKLNGYSVIMFSLFDYNHGLRYDPKAFEWLKEALEKANEENPNQPIFFAMHAAISGTNLPSEQGNYWATESKELYDLLAQYPQVITFGSHLHYPLQDEREIFQKDFTSVDTGSVYYASIPKKMTNPITGETMVFEGLDGAQPAGAFTGFSQGLMIEVDKDNNTRITRLDFINKTTIKDPWIIPAVTNEHHLTQYSEESLKANNTAPVFPENAAVTVLPNDPENDPYKNQLNMTFTSATDNDLVLAYEIQYIEKESGDVINKQYTYSDFYLYPTQDEMAQTTDFSTTKRALYPMKPNYPYDYYVEIRAVDCFGMKSDPIRSAVIPGDPSGLEEDLSPTLDPRNQWDFKLFTDYSYLAEGYVPQKGVDFDSWPTANTENFHPYVATSKNGYAGSTAITKQINGAANQFDVISWNAAADEFNKYYHTDFTGAEEFWVWVDFTDVEFDYFYFGFREGLFYGTEYQTQVKSPLSDCYFYIQDGNGGWTARPFMSDGQMALGGYKGFIRFDVEYFVNEGGIPMFPDNLKTFKIWFSLENDTDFTGKTFTIDHIGFAGPSLNGATSTVGEMLALGRGDKVTKPELQAACGNADKKVEAGQGSAADDSWQAYLTALESAKTVAEKTNPSASEVETAYMTLKEAEAALTAKPEPDIDVSDLQAAYNTAKEMVDAGQGRYTDATWKVLTDAIDAAGILLENPTTQEAVDAAAEALDTAIAGLAEKTDPPVTSEDETVDVEALNTAIAKAKKILDAGQGEYNAQSWEKLQQAYNLSTALLEGSYTQKQVDNMTATLIAAIDAVLGGQPATGAASAGVAAAACAVAGAAAAWVFRKKERIAG